MTRGEEMSTMRSVTDGRLTLPDARACAERAAAAAHAAARSAGVSIQDITELEEILAVGRLYEGIWRRDAAPPISTELLRAFAKAGNYVGGAFDGGALVGACVGFFSAPAEGAMHSHIAGVSAAVRGRNVGFALKLHQRAWALQRGVSLIAWTFDPLVSRNAYFNLAKLGAEPVEYLPNFYGGLRDGINDGDDSDRLLIHWALGDPAVEGACAGHSSPGDAVAERERGAVVALGVSPFGTPVSGQLAGATSLVAVPPDIEAMRSTDPGLAKEWRAAVREALVGLMSDGGRITGFDRAGWYIIRRIPREGMTP